MPFAAFFYEIPKPFLIAAMVMGFVWFWPVGLAILAGLIASGRLGRGCGPGRWYATAEPSSAQCGPGWSREDYRWAKRQAKMQAKWGWTRPAATQAGNSAFDEYRAETLRRLEAEQQEFVEYLERLRRARDKAEFDAFMADRRNTPPASEHPPTN